MHRRMQLISILVIFAFMSGVGSAGAAGGGPAGPSGNPSLPNSAFGTAFTYQGQLQSGGSAVTGSCDMAFRLYDAATAGTQVGAAITATVAVAGGQFTVPLDFGGGAFNGQARWLDIQVKCSADPSFITLAPRQPLTPAPYAIAALSTGALLGRPISSTAPVTGQVLKWNGTYWTPDVDNTGGGGAFWALTGNAGTTPANFIGTTDNMGLSLAVSGTAALRILPNANSPILVGGYSGNLVSGVTAYGVIIGGGGGAGQINSVQGGDVSFDTISGGASNVISGTDVNQSVIGGGTGNNIGPTGNWATVSGGAGNQVTGNTASIGGGWHNTAGGSSAAIGGGSYNVASGPGATIGGGGWDGLFNSGNVAAGRADTIGGGIGNFANEPYSMVGGGFDNKITGVSGNSATIDGGFSNAINGTLANGSVIGGGAFNVISGTTASQNVIGGGGTNIISGTDVNQSVIGGGTGNSIGPTGTWATVSGGNGNQITGNTATIGGGWHNIASGGSATVAGGSYNVASGQGATIGGGGWDGSFNLGNVAAGQADTIGGGISNTADSYVSTIGGGYDNTAGDEATVGGGMHNKASGQGATVPGGVSDIASAPMSFAAGNGAHAVHIGTFVWADNSAAVLTSTAANQFLVRASGGISLTTNASATTGCNIPAGGGAWNCTSDRNLKANFDAVDGLQVLNVLAGIPIQTWNFKSQAASIRHMGPMAQDFHAAFGVGENDTTISTVDAPGVALAAIQGLYQVVKGQDNQITILQQKNAEQQQTNADLQARLTALEQKVNGSAPPSPAAGLPLGWLLFGTIALLNVGGLVGYRLARRAPKLAR